MEIEREQRDYEELRQKDQEELRAAEAEAAEGGDEAMEDADGDTAAAPDVQGDDTTADDAMDTAPAPEPEPAAEKPVPAEDIKLNDAPLQTDPVDDTKDVEDPTEAEIITGEDTVIY